MKDEVVRNPTIKWEQPKSKKNKNEPELDRTCEECFDLSEYRVLFHKHEEVQTIYLCAKHFQAFYWANAGMKISWRKIARDGNPKKVIT